MKICITGGPSVGRIVKIHNGEFDTEVDMA